MKKLRTLVEEMLKAERIEIFQSDENLIIGRTKFLGALTYMLFWIFPTLDLTDLESELLESKLLGEFHLYSNQYPKAIKYFISHSREFSKRMSDAFKEFDIKQQTENQFFDTSYTYESDSGKVSSSFIKRIADPEIKNIRIPQPYIEINWDDEILDTGDDLLVDLLNFRELIEPQSARLNIIIGPAGSGKTYLFRAMFVELHNYFLKRKNQRELFPRPIPLISEYLRNSNLIRTESLLQSFIENEIATNLHLDTFKWMAKNNYSSWLFDGLDELYSDDDEFFTEILDLLDVKTSKAQIYLFSRDSLLTSSKNFYDFLDNFMERDSGVNIRLYKLADWNDYSKRSYTWLRLNNRLPDKEDKDTPEIIRFLDYLNSTENIRSISSLPYYCYLLFEEFYRKQEAKSNKEQVNLDSASSLLQAVVNGMIRREMKKGLISSDWFIDKEKGLDEWLRTIGLEFYKQGNTSLLVNEIEFYSQIVLSDALNEDEERDAVTALSQFPLFTKDGSVGLIGFKHELIAEYLAAKDLSIKLDSDPLIVGKAIGARKDFHLSLMAQILSSAVRNKKNLFDSLLNKIVSQSIQDSIFNNLLQILIYSADTDDKKDRISKQIVFEGRDMSNVHFKELNLHGVSFVKTNLTRVIFDDCVLENSNLQFAHLIGTKFIYTDKVSLKGIQFGNLDNFSYVYANSKKIEDFDVMKKWVREVTKVKYTINGPCPTTQRFRYLFEKYVDRNGVPKTHQLLHSALIAGKQFPQAASIEECIDSCIRFGYLQPPNHRSSIRRSIGSKWDEIVGFVTDLELSVGLRSMIDKTCPLENCKHIYSS